MNIIIKKTGNNYDINVTFNESLLDSCTAVGNLQRLIVDTLKEIKNKPEPVEKTNQV